VDGKRAGLLCKDCNSYDKNIRLPDGTHLLTVTATDYAGNVGFATVSFTIDTKPPTLKITGFTADGSKMKGTYYNSYKLITNNVASKEYLIQFLTGTQANENLKSEYFGLTLVSSTVSAANLKAYYDARGVPEPFLSYLKGAVDKTNPFVYIKGDGTKNVKLIDGARHSILSLDTDMAIPGDYPVGTYVVSGQIKDLAGNPTTVTLKLIVTRA
jgi:hypothetical protein